MIKELISLDQNTQKKGILENAEETYWEWSGQPTTLGKLTTTQLKIIKKSIKNYSNRKTWFNNKSEDILTNINIIFDYGKKDLMYDVYNQASDRFMKRSYKIADGICKQIIPLIEKKFSPDLRDN